MNSDWEVGDDHLAQLIAQKSSDILCRLDDTGVIRWVADSLASSVGWTREQLADFVHAAVPQLAAQGGLGSEDIMKLRYAVQQELR